ncbi:MAG: T9SS type A sorting domain-containing protein [Deltaproteobacteria bacterium]|nr:T9SS type A sorting domain-containing protein [Deltaproteobacteria bacterium]
MNKYICLLFFSIPISVFSQNYTEDLSNLINNPDTKITMLPDSIVEIGHSWFGITKQVDISDQKMHISSLDDDMQIFDLINTNDSLYAHRFDSIATYPIGGFLGYPMVIGDFNQNGKLDFSGMYKIEQDYELGQAAILEQQSEKRVTLELAYVDTVEFPLAITDLDKDGLNEMNFRRKQHFYNFEKRSQDSYPDSLNIIHEMWQRSNSIGSETFTDMDNDNIIDVIYVGDDTLSPSGQKVFIAEYDPLLNSFKKRYSNRPEDWRVSGISAGDFDNDGYKEFVTGAIHGHVYVYENTRPDTYQRTFEYSRPTPNAYLNCTTNDMDNNGKQEFFIGGSSYYWGVSGTWVFWYESDGNDNYTIARSFFLSGTGVLGTTEMYSYDVNNDGKLDLVFAFGEHVVILVWNNANQEFELFYFNFIDRGYTEVQSVNIYDVDEDGAPDLFISIRNSHTEPRIRSHYFKSNLLTGITNSSPTPITTFTLSQNYPNPFNNRTRIPFFIMKPSTIDLTIYDITGREVITLVRSQSFRTGTHEIHWNGTNNNGKEVSSGLYLYKLETSSFSDFKKLLLIK